MDKPFGAIEEYDALNRLIDFDDPAIISRSLEIAADNTWGLCRCRMAAIIEATARRFGWTVDQAEAQRRALIMARLYKRPA